MRLLTIACLLASAAATAAVADTIVIEHFNKSTAPIPPPTGPRCLPNVEGLSPLSGTNAAIIVADGTNIDAFAATHKFLSDRGASISVVCAPSSENVLGGAGQQAMLTRMYYPLGKVSCTTMGAGWSIASNDVVIIPDGYTATLPMRRSGAVQSVVSDFVSSQLDGAHSALLLVSGASELLIDSGVIAKTNCSTMPMAATPSIASAVSKACGAHPTTTSHHISYGNHHVVVGAHHHDLPFMLAHWQSAIRNTTMPEVACNNTNTTTPIDFNTAIAAANVNDLTDADWSAALSRTDAELEVVHGGNSTAMVEACKNAQGVNFCENAPTSIIVAHGSHARAVRSFANVLRHMPTLNHVFCPDADEEHSFDEGYVYLSAQPGYVPTHRVQCTAYYNRTDILTNTLVLIPGGDVATHRTLRVDASLVKALQYTGTFSAFGSGLTLMNAIINNNNAAASNSNSDEKAGGEGDEAAETDVTNAPYYIETNVDMGLLGFNASTSDEPVMRFRNHMERRTKVLGGYKTAEAFEGNVALFLNEAAKSLVWDNAPSGVADILVMAYVFGLSGVIVIGMLVVLCVRAQTSANRNVARVVRSRSSSMNTEALSTKFV